MLQHEKTCSNIVFGGCSKKKKSLYTLTYSSIVVNMSQTLKLITRALNFWCYKFIHFFSFLSPIFYHCFAETWNHCFPLTPINSSQVNL